ncbi:hypothetical protein EYF80_010098 [Liparis tanakae]|uniref:Uncharacterized protein n=1 Tax=Liparis tanakae TaxID=230148 RepID=A0A4Z2IQC7_9TELE|nr:hypothetical protein EYF80_010098 [Liparis tanakae]
MSRLRVVMVQVSLVVTRSNASVSHVSSPLLITSNPRMPTDRPLTSAERPSGLIRRLMCCMYAWMERRGHRGPGWSEEPPQDVSSSNTEPGVLTATSHRKATVTAGGGLSTVHSTFRNHKLVLWHPETPVDSWRGDTTQAIANGKEHTADHGLDPPKTTSNGMMKMLTMSPGHHIS